MLQGTKGSSAGVRKKIFLCGIKLHNLMHLRGSYFSLGSIQYWLLLETEYTLDGPLVHSSCALKYISKGINGSSAPNSYPCLWKSNSVPAVMEMQWKCHSLVFLNSNCLPTFSVGAGKPAECGPGRGTGCVFIYLVYAAVAHSILPG